MRQYPKFCSLLQDQPCLLGVLSGHEDDWKDGSGDFHQDWDPRVQLPQIQSVGNSQILPKSWSAL